MTKILNLQGEIAARRIGRAQKKRQRGVVLFDAMMSLFIGTAVIIAGISLALAATRTAEAARQSNLGYGAARQILENMRGGDVSKIVIGSNLSVTPYGLVPQLSELPSATATVSVAVVSDSGLVTYARNVTATVAWHPAGGVTKTRTMSTRISPNGVGH